MTNLESQRQERVIDGVTYIVQPLPFGVGRRALTRLVKVAGPLLAAGARGRTVGEQAAGVLGALSDALSDDDVTYFAKAFGDASWYRDGDKDVPLVEVNQEAHFTARYLAFLEWLTFSISVNYSLFFDGVLKKGAGGGLLRAVTGSPSTGGSG